MVLLKRPENYENLTKDDARSSRRCTLRVMIKKLVSAVLMACALSQMANAMGPMGDLSHRHFYKNQEWIWQSEQSQPTVGANGNAIGQPAPSAASQSPVAFMVPTQPQKGMSAGSFLTFFVPRNPSPSVAFFVPTQPQKGVSAGSFLAFFVPRNPSPSVAFFVPTQPQKGVSAGVFLGILCSAQSVSVGCVFRSDSTAEGDVSRLFPGVLCSAQSVGCLKRQRRTRAKT